MYLPVPESSSLLYAAAHRGSRHLSHDDHCTSLVKARLLDPSTAGDWAGDDGFPTKPMKFRGTGARLRHDLGCG